MLKLNEIKRMQKLAGLLKENNEMGSSLNSQSDIEKIENWVHDKCPFINELTPKQIDSVIESHLNDWNDIKDSGEYNVIEDYFNNVESNDGWLYPEDDYEPDQYDWDDLDGRGDR